MLWRLVNTFRVCVNAASRYVHARPLGVLLWLTPSTKDSAESALFRYLLRVMEPVLLDIPTLSAQLELAAPNLAQALFSLNRTGAIQIGTFTTVNKITPPSQRGMTALPLHLAQLAAQSAHPAVLADSAGLCIASAGLSPVEAQSVAAGIARPLALESCSRTSIDLGKECVYLTTSRAAQDDHSALLQLAHCLLTFH